MPAVPHVMFTTVVRPVSNIVVTKPDGCEVRVRMVLELSIDNNACVDLRLLHGPVRRIPPCERFQRFICGPQRFLSTARTAISTTTIGRNHESRFRV